MHLVVPTLVQLPEYVAALERGWSGNTIDPEGTAREELIKIRENPSEFLAQMTDLEPKERFVTLPDGSRQERIPSIRRWMWDEGLCGSINFRWQRGTSELPPHVLGHIGYATVPWRREKGYAKEALRLILLEAKREGLPYVELIADPENVASQRVILANGGVFVESFRTQPAYGGELSLRYRIALG